ncbi:MAG: ATP-binding cassette domain-containing protein [Deltaproteobacteria bacterium]|nr:ATP-binding cassette domain-containing protein [Deltaproteobacteria bacterium]
MIELRNMSFSYGENPPLFEEFNLRIERGEACAVIGPSGCGKTTLLYLLAGLLRPTGGEIIIVGSPISRPRPKTGLVLQDHGLLPWATVRENAELGLKIRRFYGPDGLHAPRGRRVEKPEIRARVDYWLKKLEIDGIQDKYPSQISRGQRQRTAIARTLALDPDLLLLDEPFSALDARIREDLQRAVMALHRESDLTVIIVTHDIEEAVLVGGKIIVLEQDSNRTPRVVENESAGKEDFRYDMEFRRQCETIRRMLGRDP